MEEFSAREADLGVLGTGRMGSRLAAMFARAGRRVILGSRDYDRASAIVDRARHPDIARRLLPRCGPCPGDPCRQCSSATACSTCSTATARLLTGKLLIDISNPFNADYSDFVTPWDSSGAEELQRRFPQARVVGAFKNVFWEVFDHPAIRRDAKRRARSPATIRQQKPNSCASPKERLSATSTPAR